MSLFSITHVLLIILYIQVVRNIPVGDTTLSTVALSHSGRMLFGGTARGAVWSFKFPLTMPVDGKPTWEEKPGHGMAITKVSIDICLNNGWVMVFNATFNNILVISWQTVLLVEETGENHRPTTSH